MAADGSRGQMGENDVCNQKRAGEDQVRKTAGTQQIRSSVKESMPGPRGSREQAESASHLPCEPDDCSSIPEPEAGAPQGSLANQPRQLASSKPLRDLV